MKSTSPRFILNYTDIYKTFRGSAFVFISVFVVAGLEGIAHALGAGEIDLGTLNIMTPALVSGVSFLIESTRRYFRSYE